MKLLEMGLTGAVLVAVILPVRALILHRLPKGTLLLLWWLALARFLLPFSLASPVSVYALLNAPAVSETFGRPASQPVAVNLLPEDAGTVSEAVPQFPAALVVWAAGSVGCALFYTVTALRCGREFRSSLPVGEAAVNTWLLEHPLRRKVQVRTSDRIAAPLTYGIFRPVMLLPESFPFQDAELTGYVLTHEWVHIRRLDGLTKYLIIIAACLHWWNPMVWVLYGLFNRDMELSCDEMVVNRCGTGSRADYARALIRMEAYKSGIPPFCSSFSRNAMEERIYAIMKMKKMTRQAAAISAATVFAVGVLFATSARAADPMAAVTDSGSGDSGSMYAHAVSAVDWTEERELLESFQKYGISYDSAGKIYFHGERVRWFWDGYEIWEEGTLLGWSMRYEYLDREGTVDVHTLHARKDNGDGSWDGYGPLLDIVPYSAEEFASRSYEELYERSTYAVTEDSVLTEEPAYSGTADIAEGTDRRDTILEEGTAYSATADIENYVEGTRYSGTADITEYKERTAYSGTADIEEYVEGTGYTNKTDIAEYKEGTDTVVVAEGGSPVTEAVTEGRATVATATVQGSGIQDGRTFAEIFAVYEPYGIAYQEKDGIRELFYQNRPVAQFIDRKPDGGVFSFESNGGRASALTVRTAYDAAGKLTGVAVDSQPVSDTES